jgi:hypothetical protein
VWSVSPSSCCFGAWRWQTPRIELVIGRDSPRPLLDGGRGYWRQRTSTVDQGRLQRTSTRRERRFRLASAEAQVEDVSYLAVSSPASLPALCARAERTSKSNATARQPVSCRTPVACSRREKSFELDGFTKRCVAVKCRGPTSSQRLATIRGDKKHSNFQRRGIR